MVSRKRPVNKGIKYRKPGIRDWPVWEGRFYDLGGYPGEYFKYRFEGGPQDGETGEYGPAQASTHCIGDPWPGKEVERKFVVPGLAGGYVSVQADYRIGRKEGFGRRTVLVIVFEGLSEHRVETNPNPR